jgi:IS30 family transposase
VNCPSCGCRLEPPNGRKDKRWVVSMIEKGRESGWTLAQIAQAIGMHSSTVEKYCARFGIRKNLVTKPVETDDESRYA